VANAPKPIKSDKKLVAGKRLEKKQTLVRVNSLTVVR
jgi:hypothetical protein